MKRKGVTTLLIAALSVQAAAVLAAIGMTAAQAWIKPFFIPGLGEIFTIPYASLLKTVLRFLVYGIGFLVVSRKNRSNADTVKKEAIIFIVIGTIVAVLSEYVNSIVSAGMAYMGTMEFASYTVLETTITMVTVPLSWAAFALFGMACGGYYGSCEESKQSNGSETWEDSENYW